MAITPLYNVSFTNIKKNNNVSKQVAFSARPTKELQSLGKKAFKFGAEDIKNAFKDLKASLKKADITPPENNKRDVVTYDSVKNINNIWLKTEVDYIYSGIKVRERFYGSMSRNLLKMEDYNPITRKLSKETEYKLFHDWQKKHDVNCPVKEILYDENGVKSEIKTMDYFVKEGSSKADLLEEIVTDAKTNFLKTVKKICYGKDFKETNEIYKGGVLSKKTITDKKDYLMIEHYNENGIINKSIDIKNLYPKVRYYREFCIKTVTFYDEKGSKSFEKIHDDGGKLLEHNFYNKKNQIFPVLARNVQINPNTGKNYQVTDYFSNGKIENQVKFNQKTGKPLGITNYFRDGDIKYQVKFDEITGKRLATDFYSEETGDLKHVIDYDPVTNKKARKITPWSNGVYLDEYDSSEKIAKHSGYDKSGNLEYELKRKYPITEEQAHLVKHNLFGDLREDSITGSYIEKFDSYHEGEQSHLVKHNLFGDLREEKYYQPDGKTLESVHYYYPKTPIFKQDAQYTEDSRCLFKEIKYHPDGKTVAELKKYKMSEVFSNNEVNYRKKAVLAEDTVYYPDGTLKEAKHYDITQEDSDNYPLEEFFYKQDGTIKKYIKYIYYDD